MHGAAVVHGIDGESPSGVEEVVAKVKLVVVGDRRSHEADAEGNLRAASGTTLFLVAEVHDPDTLPARVPGRDSHSPTPQMHPVSLLVHGRTNLIFPLPPSRSPSLRHLRCRTSAAAARHPGQSEVCQDTALVSGAWQALSHGGCAR